MLYLNEKSDVFIGYVALINIFLAPNSKNPLFNPQIPPQPWEKFTYLN